MPEILIYSLTSPVANAPGSPEDEPCFESDGLNSILR